MKFKGEPNLLVRITTNHLQRTTGMKHFSFDENGEFETENETLIDALSQRYEICKPETKEPEKTDIRKCKKCNFTCDTQGELLQHYKKSHPKEG